MTDKSDVHAPDPIKVLEFIKNIRPFRELDEVKLQEVAEQCTIDFFPKGTLVLRQAVSDVTHLYLIQKGGVKVYLTDSEGAATLRDFRGEGGYFGALGVIRNSKATFNVETVEDTFCYLLEKEKFLNLIRTHPQVAQFYLESLSEEMVQSAYSELRRNKVETRATDAFYLFSVEVQDVVKRPLAKVSASEIIRRAARKMAALRIGSLIVCDQTDKIVGIITDKDLRSKVVAKGLNCDLPVENIMTSPVRTVSAHASCFDALLKMMRDDVHHLVVEKNNAVIGIVTAHDIMVHQGSSPVYLVREIVAQRKIEGLYELSRKVPTVVRTLVEEGAKANNITRMISVLNDHVVERLLTLLRQEMGPPPQPFCWLMMGSEGRKEQTFKTDQDNALVYETPPDDWEETKRAKLYFRRFGNEAIKHLEACGYPLCKGEMMASNPKWRKPYMVWQRYFDHWLNAPEPREVLHATIFFDFRPGYGTRSLGEQLRDYLAAEAPHKGIFLMHLAKDCLVGKPPLTFFRNFIVEKDGVHKNRLDLKTRGLVPIVDFGRVMALKYGIKETNTVERLEALAAGKHIPRELFTDALEAYEFQMQVRLIHQLRMLEQNLTPDNFIDPAELSDIEKMTLKEAFAVIGRIQSYLKDEFRVVE